MLSRESTIQVIDQNVMSSVVDEEVVLLNIKRGQYYSLSAVGVDIWNMLKQPTSVADIVAQISQSYDISSAEAEADVMALLADLEGEGLVRVRP